MTTTMTTTKLFETVLVANRGEIAVRVMRTLRQLGIRSVAVYSDADAGARHVREADVAVHIGPAPARESYLSIERVIAAAVETGAQAIHPGYGFLSENAAFARACGDAGIVFVGPPTSAIEAMGDKIAAKATVAAAGVSVVPGSDGAGLDDDALAAAATATGFPVLLKPSAGGGGKGMRLVEHERDLASAIASARREAASSFGDDTLLVERFITNPRHIEIQVLADTAGRVVHLGERECSLQRRHQKIIEEAPSPLLTAAQRDEMGRQAVEAARACGYTGAGTVEFIVAGDRPDDFFFMEMNTRLQVEHPVTELVYDVDLVEWQLRVAAGEPLGFEQSDLVPRGHAVEARVYAEDAERGFLPTGGRAVEVYEPHGEGIRVDSGIDGGTVVGSDYDPMLAKVIAWGADRAQALRRLDGALAQTAVLGVTTNVGFLRRLLDVPEVASGDLDTGLVERELDGLVGEHAHDAAIVVAVVAPLGESLDAIDPWHSLVGWRHGGTASIRRRVDVGGRRSVDVFASRVEGEPGAPTLWRVAIDDRPELQCELDLPWCGVGTVVIDGRRLPVYVARDGATSHIASGGSSIAVTLVDERGAAAASGAGGGDGVVRSPMPGTVISVDVEGGARVVAGDVVAVVEAMKMEHSLTSPFDGVVANVHVAAGASVALDEPIVTVVPADPDVESDVEPAPEPGGAPE